MRHHLRRSPGSRSLNNGDTATTRRLGVVVRSSQITDDDADEEEDVFDDPWDESSMLPRIKDNRGIGDPKFKMRRQKPYMPDPDTLYDFEEEKYDRVDRFKYWDFRNGDFIDGYKVEVDTERPHVNYIPAGFTYNDDDEWWDFEKDRPVPPDVLEQLKANDTEPVLTEEEARRKWIEDMVRDEKFKLMLEAHGTRNPSEDVCQVLAKALSYLDPSGLHIKDMTPEYSPVKQTRVWFDVTSEYFEGFNTMERQHILDVFMEPVYRTGVKFLEGLYRAPSEEGRNIVPLVTRSNISNTVALEMNFTNVEWHNYESDPLIFPEEEYDIDEDDQPNKFATPVESLRKLPWYDDDYEPHPKCGELTKPYTETAAYYGQQIRANKSEAAKAAEEDRGTGWQ